MFTKIGHVLASPVTALAGTIDESISSQVVKGILRHLGTILAGILVTKGYLDASQTDAFVGALVALGCIVASAQHKTTQQP